MSLSYRWGKYSTNYNTGTKVPALQVKPGEYITVHDRKNRINAVVKLNEAAQDPKWKGGRWDYWMRTHDGTFGFAYGHRDLEQVLRRVEEDEHYLDKI